MTLRQQEAIDGCLGVEVQHDETLFELSLDAAPGSSSRSWGARCAAAGGVHRQLRTVRDRIELTDGPGDDDRSLDVRRQEPDVHRSRPVEGGDVTVWTTHPWVLVTPLTPAEDAIFAEGTRRP
jgi:hypothetical protein